MPAYNLNCDFRSAFFVLAFATAGILGCGSASSEQVSAEEVDSSASEGAFTADEGETKGSKTSEKADEPGMFTNSIGMQFKLISAGTFTMGSPPDEEGSSDDERQHQVTISEPYYMGMHEVTQAQYVKIMGKNPSKLQGDALAERHPKTKRIIKDGDGSNHPVEQVSWGDAVEFCRKLSELPTEKTAGYVYRLPTEAEWEYACRVGTTTAYGFGDDVLQLGSYAWFKDNSSEKTHPVGQKQPNAWGLYDMHGNVWEWCQDWYADDLPTVAATDPTGPSSGSLRVYRGGSWLSNSYDCRSAKRLGGSPRTQLHAFGFRVLRSPTEEAAAAAASAQAKAAAAAAAAQAKAAAAAAQAKAAEVARMLAEPAKTNSLGMEFKLLPGGVFTMGTGRKAHQVTLTKAFEFGVYEVTQEQYERVMGGNPAEFNGQQNPVDQVSWNDAVEFCRKLSALPSEKAAGYVYRLPTEAEWEYACRAGTTKVYSFGDSYAQLDEYAWYSTNSGSTTHPVGQKKPNAWGLYDMHGNVWEWCSDWYRDYPEGAVTDPVGSEEGSHRVSRGGSWVSSSDYCRSAYRDGSPPGYRLRHYGFRVLRCSVK